MRFGVWTPLPNTIQSEPALDAAMKQLGTYGGAGEDDLSLAFARDVLQKGERYGFDLTLVAQRFLGPDPDCIVLGSALAALTAKMHIMPAVYPGIMTPQVVAKMGATLDRISGGRAALNIITGWFREEFQIFSNGDYLHDESARYRRIDEYIQVLKGLWTQPSFSFKGEFFAMDNARLPTRPATLPHPPLYAATRHEHGKEIVARECQCWFVPVQPGVDNYEANFATIAREVDDMRRQAARHGNKIEFAVSCYVVCEPTTDAALKRAYEMEEMGKSGRIALASARGLGAGCVGSPDLIAKRLKRYEEIGVTQTMLHFHPMLDGLDTFAREVMPLMG